jgi:hypothetical protein
MYIIIVAERQLFLTGPSRVSNSVFNCNDMRLLGMLSDADAQCVSVCNAFLCVQLLNVRRQELAMENK